ncbi:hypothetical protein SAMN04244572_04526 [Azotobacter beijerinckii]|uniref:MazG nucleotide pyrophosphohydrolase domain-containing protein n=1 Tax=Azotobacter beijerinckii TaxID=170623 RepID=A0A1H6ZUY5_9GAMM|nr:hypothetical protein [Azotobacter beijerinckii]SEJ57293.1 hypothetical protein SAMN04244572_04526 [Azotobacter beijerinckii]
MSTPKPIQWYNLLPHPEHLAKMATEDVDAAARTAECKADTICFGIAAIGNLLANTADAGELSDSTARDLGWLLESLGQLTANLTDVQRATKSEMRSRKEKALQADTSEG